MNVDVNARSYLKPALESSPGPIVRAISNCLRSAARFVDALRAAQMVTRQAERYYAMSDRQLASIGLKRDGVPVELRRALERNQPD